MKIFIKIIGILLLILLVFIGYLYFTFPKFEPQVKVVEISNDRGEVIFIKKKVWGLLGNDQVIVISNSSNEDFKPDDSSEYIYKGLIEVFYKVENDTLFFYTQKESLVPNNFQSLIKVKQIFLTNLDYDKFKNEYKQLGLKIF